MLRTLPMHEPGNSPSEVVSSAESIRSFSRILTVLAFCKYQPRCCSSSGCTPFVVTSRWIELFCLADQRKDHEATEEAMEFRGFVRLMRHARRFCLLVGVSLITSQSTAGPIEWDDEDPPPVLEIVVIWGDLGFVDETGFFAGGGGGGSVIYMDQLSNEQEQVLAAETKKDVRCVPGYSSQWVSTNPDAGDRHRAANSAY